jgi:hypothetical protein
LAVNVVGVAITPPAVPTFVQPILAGRVPADINVNPPPVIPSYYVSTTHRTTIVADNGQQITVTNAALLPANFPYKLLVGWGTATQEIIFALSSGGSNILNVTRGQDGTAQQVQAAGVSVDHGVSAADFNMLWSHVLGGPLSHGEASLIFASSTALPSGQYVGQELKTQDTNQRLLWNGSTWEPGLPPHTHTTAALGGPLGIAPGVSAPYSWQIFGHSYVRWAFQIWWESGRMDALFRRLVGSDFNSWRNFGVTGSKLVTDGRASGGWARAMQELPKSPPSGQNVHGYPYSADGGAYLLIWGANDLGVVPGSTMPQITSAYQQALRAVITRCRASVIYEDNYVPASGSVGQPVYGAGFTVTNSTSDYSSGTSLHDATSTTNANITLTIPADYAGETIYIQFVANAGVLGGTVTLSGTAGVTGTIVTSSIIPSGASTHVPVVKRITGLTAANAGQTIILTVTAIDAGGTVRFDCWGLEADNPPPVIVANMPRLTQTGYNGYTNTFGDPDVVALNAAMASVIAEFDGMVQIANLDSAMNKNANLFGADGLHPNEVGNSYCAQALYNALALLVPPVASQPAAALANSFPTAGSQRKPRGAFQWYASEGASHSTLTIPAVGSMYALPYLVTEGREIYSFMGLRLAQTASGAGTVRLGVYDDVKWVGYPQCLYSEATSGGPLSTGTAIASVSQGGLYIVLDPGLYWLVYETVTTGTGVVLESMVGPDRTNVMPFVSLSNQSVNISPIAWQLTGQGTGAFPSVFPAGATVASNAPKIGMVTV